MHTGGWRKGKNYKRVAYVNMCLSASSPSYMVDMMISDTKRPCPLNLYGRLKSYILLLDMGLLQWNFFAVILKSHQTRVRIFLWTCCLHHVTQKYQFDWCHYAFLTVNVCSKRQTFGYSDQLRCLKMILNKQKKFTRQVYSFWAPN